MGGGGTRVEYQSPQITKDDTFERYLSYQQEREAAAERRAADERAAAKAKEDARRSSAQLSLGSLRTGIESQLRQGLISYSDAVGQLRDYSSKYDLTPPEADVANLTKLYTQELLPGRRATGIEAAYEELLGRQATSEEKSKATQRFQQGYYSSVSDLKDSLAKSQEYQDKFNQSYLDNYYDTQFGKQAVDSKGKKTGQRTFNFDKNLLPAYQGDLSKKTNVKTPDFKDQFTGTPAEIEEQLQNIRSTRQYIYSAGLTNLQGEIDKETQKLKNEGTKEVARIGRESNMYSNLLSGFWS
jgi:hypothetical protein